MKDKGGKGPISGPILRSFDVVWLLSGAESFWFTIPGSEHRSLKTT